MAKNLCGKTRKVNDPYEIWVNDRAGWQWRVLKKCQADDAKPYGRWFCAVKSPMTYGSYDMGDTYVTDVKGNGNRKLKDWEMSNMLINDRW